MHENAGTNNGPFFVLPSNTADNCPRIRMNIRKLLTSSLVFSFSASLAFGFALSGLVAPQPALAFSPVMSAADGSGPLSRSSLSQSFNWSGYVAANGNYTAVSGSWTVPSVSNTSSALQADATWVGIGGVTTQDLIQVGTEAIVNGSNPEGSGSVANDVVSNPGNIDYEAWIELLPAGSITVPVTIRSGDSVSASITEESPGEWLVIFRDNTTEQSYEATESYASSNSSAEWIEEMPMGSENNSFIPLDSFGVIQFTGGSDTENGQSMNIAQSGAQLLTMVNSSGQTALAVPSPLGADGGSFTVSRTTAVPASVGPGGNGGYSRRPFVRRGNGISGYSSQPQSIQYKYSNWQQRIRLVIRKR
jgi:hypothetical protein